MDDENLDQDISTISERLTDLNDGNLVIRVKEINDGIENGDLDVESLTLDELLHAHARIHMLFYLVKEDSKKAILRDLHQKIRQKLADKHSDYDKLDED